ncbi:MAG: type II toxin-antitoxin system RelE/ParE family toxin [Ideonella sp.]|nr:type II toxin-antitoxin system RelE/ParE family toxin [Ideonella sp.]MCC7459539.1 type II toxin-antitoxin system RelE/ParE family toxin [Nitrospira sp.]
MSYVLAPEAEEELAQVVTFYAQHVSLNVARNFLLRFEEKAQLLTEFPGIGTPTTKGRRLFPIGRYPYSILYRAHEGTIRISAIAAHARRPGYWQKRQP